MNKHYIRLNKNGFIIKSFSTAFEQPLDTDVYIEDGGRHYNLPNIYDDNNIPQLQYIDGKIVEVENVEANKELELEQLRQQRQTDCFDIFNRNSYQVDDSRYSEGYRRLMMTELNEVQQAELKEWYEAWCDVTDTLVMPTKPEWLI